MSSTQNVFNPITNLYQTQLEASRQFADVIFTGTERIDQVLLDATHRAFNEQMRFAQSLAAVRDPQGAAGIQSAFMSQRPDQAMDWQREMVRIFSEMQTELGQSMRSYMEQIGGAAANGAGAARTDDDETGTAFNPVTGIFGMWESAMREVASMANRNMAAAQNTFENAAGNVFTSATDADEEADDEQGSGAKKGRRSSARRS